MLQGVLLALVGRRFPPLAIGILLGDVRRAHAILEAAQVLNPFEDAASMAVPDIRFSFPSAATPLEQVMPVPGDLTVPVKF